MRGGLTSWGGTLTGHPKWTAKYSFFVLFCSFSIALRPPFERSQVTGAAAGATGFAQHEQQPRPGRRYCKVDEADEEEERMRKRKSYK